MTSDQNFGRDLLGRWNDTRAKIPVTRTPTGLPLPRLALPEIDEPGEIARFISAKVCRANFLISTRRIPRCISSRFARLRVSKKIMVGRDQSLLAVARARRKRSLRNLK